MEGAEAVAFAVQGPWQIPSHLKARGFGEGKDRFSQAAGSARDSPMLAWPVPARSGSSDLILDIWDYLSY